uniref:Uncharacterized protein n=1 Tax=Ananas comosus var. bracteatus TaxID=296719 RepID=A0A6V7P9D1_ANACO|nr:unnamed protein product [Ananas comosus var. bracteatus]
MVRLASHPHALALTRAPPSSSSPTSPTPHRDSFFFSSSPTFLHRLRRRCLSLPSPPFSPSPSPSPSSSAASDDDAFLPTPTREGEIYTISLFLLVPPPPSSHPHPHPHPHPSPPPPQEKRVGGAVVAQERAHVFGDVIAERGVRARCFSGSLPSINIDSLQSFNISDNDLYRLIPSPLSRFPVSSFAGNLGLDLRRAAIQSLLPLPGAMGERGDPGPGLKKKKKRLSGGVGGKVGGHGDDVVVKGGGAWGRGQRGRSRQSGSSSSTWRHWAPFLQLSSKFYE